MKLTFGDVEESNKDSDKEEEGAKGDEGKKPLDESEETDL